MRHSRQDSSSIKNCAVHHGVSERAVRAWRVNSDPRWREWQTRQARSGCQLETFLGHDATASTPESEAENARVRFLALQRLCDQATAQGNIAGLPVLLKSAEAAQKLLRECRTAADEWRVRRRELIAGETLRELIGGYLLPVRTMIQQLPLETAVLIDPVAPGRVTEILSEWIQNRLAGLIAEAQDAITAATTPDESPAAGQDGEK